MIITMVIFPIKSLLYTVSTVSGSRLVFFPPSEFCSYWFTISKLVTISSNPDCGKTSVALCTHTSACYPRASISEWAVLKNNNIFDYNGFFFSNTKNSLKLLLQYVCLSGLMNFQHTVIWESMATTGLVIDCVEAYGKDGFSGASWTLAAHSSDIWDMSKLQDFSQPDKQNCSWGEQAYSTAANLPF